MLRRVRPLAAGTAVAAACLLPVGSALTASSASAAAPAAGTNCSTITVAAKIVPGLSLTAATQTLSGPVTISGCSPAVTSGKASVKLVTTTKVTCLSTIVAKGTAVITWNTKATSTVAMTADVYVTEGKGTLSGKVTKGLFAGGSISSTLTPTKVTGDCSPTPVTGVDLTGAFAVS